MEPLQQIDLVFLYLKDKITYGTPIGYQNIWNHFKEGEIPNQILLKEILVRLELDGFITKKEPQGTQPIYHITFKGLLFEGYESEKRRKDQQNAELVEQRLRTSKIETANVRVQKGIFWLTLILALGTSIAAIYYAIEILRYLGWIPKVLN